MFYENYSIENCIDELKSIRDEMKVLKQKEDEIKTRILNDGRLEIKGENSTMKISIRTKEVFNEEAFIEKFNNDDEFSQELKNEIIELKPKINEQNLTNAIKDEKISLDYVKPFNTITETKIISVK